jgi:hypothetical protein
MEIIEIHALYVYIRVLEKSEMVSGGIRGTKQE